MRSREAIAICVVIFPFLCAAQLVHQQKLPLCNGSNSPSVSIINDLEGVDFGPYLEIVKRQVKQRWYSLIPADAYVKHGCVSVQFKILKNGDVTDVLYKSTSGDDQLDRAASAAIAWPEALPSLPTAFKGDHLELRFIFFYNLGLEGASGDPNLRNTPAIDEAAMAPGLPTHGSTQDFARIADSVNLAFVNASTPPAGPTSGASTDGQIVPGRLVHKVDPKYPKQARKNKTGGRVVLDAMIEKNGNVTNVSIMSGELVLADAALDAVRQWSFEPYTQSGQPVQVHQQLTFEFGPHTKIGELTKPLPPPTLRPNNFSHDLDSDTEEVFQAVGHGVTPPRRIYAPDPPYDENAKKAMYQGTCLLSLIVGSNGQPRDIRVTRGLGKGLDAKAVEAVNTWRFEPGTKDGKPVPVRIVVEVVFHLY